MYEYLGVSYTTPRFIYTLSTLSNFASFADSNGREGRISPYFIHSSSNHQLPPIRPISLGYIRWILRTLFVAICYFWFTICCFLVVPKPGNGSKTEEDETLEQYLDRIWLPVSFRKYYLLPLMSSMTTCPHEALLNFPAIDCVTYAKNTYRQPHYTVLGGVQKVQDKLSDGLNIKLGATVTNVQNTDTKVLVTWVDSKTEKIDSAEFDHVIMAVTPNVVAAIYEPLRKPMSSIPIAVGESVVHRDNSTIPECGQSLRKISMVTLHPLHDARARQIMHMRSNSSATESIHQHPCSVLVTNFPIAPIDPKKTIHRARLTRVLRSPQSRGIVNKIFDKNDSLSLEKGLWCNGSRNVWLVGAWCWDGMVLFSPSRYPFSSYIFLTEYFAGVTRRLYSVRHESRTRPWCRDSVGQKMKSYLDIHTYIYDINIHRLIIILIFSIKLSI